MKHLPLIARILLGLIFFVFGLNGFLQFIPFKAEMPEGAQKFMAGMMAAPYFFPVLKGTEVIAGLLLLLNWYVPLALILLAPIVVQIALFHFILGQNGYPMTIAILALQIYLAYHYRERYKGVLTR